MKDEFILLMREWTLFLPVLMAALSKLWICGGLLVGIAGSNPAGDMDVSLSLSRDCCVLSGGSLCVGFITHPDESYWMWCIWVWLWNLRSEKALTHCGAVASWYKRTFGDPYPRNKEKQHFGNSKRPPEFFVCKQNKIHSVTQLILTLADGWRRFVFLHYNCAGRVTQICVFNTTKLGTSASSP
jgi:hypothetical protein